MQRYFTKKLNNKIVLEESDFHHIKDVMRIKDNGQIVCVFDNKSYLCKINYVNNTYDISVIEEISNDIELTKKVILYQALIKNDKFDLVIQKACELGVSEIVPTMCERSIIKVDSKAIESKISRYEKIIKEACEQSERQELPTLNRFIDLKDITLDDNTLGLLAYERDNNYQSLAPVLSEIDKYNKVALVIGPEGGFSNKEVKLLEDKGFRMVSFGKRILRSETAAMYGLAVIGHYIEGK